MTDPYYSPSVPDVIDTDDTVSSRLNRQADALLSGEARPFARTTSVRRAVRDDLDTGRAWASDQASRARDAIRDEPIKTAGYAIGLGVLIGLLLRR